ncbi:tetratricopeptide repeat protein [Pseudomonas sp. ML96]|uniref:tetratricopeptide repeat protein n=1 Tax=Pseudomonas sp. ML96 TaxID=1523503 RepID=UPI000A5464B6|nr:tetratricopeptide repeat protein [Pseudomonas sp. ML96]
MRPLFRTLAHTISGLPLLICLGAQAEVAPGCQVEIEHEPQSIAEYQSKADAGDACAQFNIGYSYYTNQDYPNTELWYAKAAEQGISRAAFEIAMLYRDNLLPGGKEHTLHWLEQAAEQGLAMAQTELGYQYLEDRQSAEELFIAMSWLEKAAEQGDAQAQYLLGEQYWSESRGTLDMYASMSYDEATERFTASDSKALYWLCKAAQNGNEFAQFSLSEAYSRGNGSGMPVDQIQSQLWLEKAAANGDEDAIAILKNDLASWQTKAELWVKRQLGDAEPRCPEVALALPQ